MNRTTLPSVVCRIVACAFRGGARERAASGGPTAVKRAGHLPQPGLVAR